MFQGTQHHSTDAVHTLREPKMFWVTVKIPDQTNHLQIVAGTLNITSQLLMHLHFQHKYTDCQRMRTCFAFNIKHQTKVYFLM